MSDELIDFVNAIHMDTLAARIANHPLWKLALQDGWLDELIFSFAAMVDFVLETPKRGRRSIDVIDEAFELVIAADSEIDKLMFGEGIPWAH